MLSHPYPTQCLFDVSKPYFYIIIAPRGNRGGYGGGYRGGYRGSYRGSN